MANQEILTDDYVAGLLAKDAKESSIKYSALGLEAFTSTSKPPANKPKPNTRFLRNIIKDTDSHNASLLAKEAAESRVRLESLAKNDHREAKASRLGGSDIRRRQLGDIAAILGGRPNKQRRTEELKRPEKESKRRNTSSDDDEPRQRSETDKRQRNRDVKDENEGLDRSRSHKSQRRRHRSESEDPERRTDDRKRRHRSRSRSPREHRESRHRHRSPKRERSKSRDDAEKERSHRSHHSSSKRKRSTSREDSGAQKERSRRSHRRSPSIERYVPRKRIESSMKKEPEAESKLDYDSDPLDDIIGPRPPPVQQVRTRGRGTISHASGIDSRFSANYDPTLDVQLDPDEENDWDQALEALRDRQKWKQQGADRLRAAGFTEEEIVKWEKGGEKREEDVRWSKKGEGREWDRGKVLDDDGIVTLEPEWGRLKGT